MDDNFFGVTDLGSNMGSYDASSIGDNYDLAGDIGFDTSDVGQWYDGGWEPYADSGGALTQSLGGGTPTSYGGAGGEGGIVKAAEDATGSTSTADARSSDNRGAFQKLLGIKADASGDTLWSDPKNLDKFIKLGLGVASLIGAKKNATQNAANTSAQTAAELQRQAAQRWNPQQQGWADSYFATARPAKTYAYPSEMRSPIVPGARGYAEGGSTGAPSGMLTLLPELFKSLGFQDQGPGGAMNEAQQAEMFRQMIEKAAMANQAGVVGTEGAQPQRMPPQGSMVKRNYAEGGDVMAEEEGAGALSRSAPFVGYVDSDTPGQQDLFQINVAGGEYVLDAESVSMLGDGNNAAGAKMLDRWRAEMRDAKRGAGAEDIPPSMAAINGEEELPDLGSEEEIPMEGAE